MSLSLGSAPLSASSSAKSGWQRTARSCCCQAGWQHACYNYDSYDHSYCSYYSLYVYIYIYTYIHMYIYIYIYTNIPQIPSSLLSSL